MKRAALCAGFMLLASTIHLQAQDSQSPALLEWIPKATMPAANWSRITGDSHDHAHLIQLVQVEYSSQVRYAPINDDPQGPGGFCGDFVELDSGSWSTVVFTPNICVDNQDRIHAVWVKAHINLGVTEIVHRVKTGDTWGDPETLASSSNYDLPQPQYGYVYVTQIKVDSNGDLYVCGFTEEPQAGYSESFLFVKTATDVIRSYPMPSDLLGIPGSIHFDVRDGTVYAVMVWNYWPNEPLKSRVAYRSSENHGATWTTQVSFGDDDHNTAPGVAMDASGTPHFIWGNDQNNTLKYRRLGGAGPQEIGTGVTSGVIVIDCFDRLNIFLAGLSHVFAFNSDPPNWVARVPQTGAPAPMGPVQAVPSRGSRFHVQDGQSYSTTHSEPRGMDGASWVPAFPGGSVNVVPVSGKLQYTLDLFSTQGVAPTQSFRLTYNSREKGAPQLASGWTMSYLMYVEYDAISNSLTLVLPNGFRLPIPMDAGGASGAYSSHGFACSVQKQTAGWNVKVRGGREFRFGAGGALGTIIEPTGNRIDVGTGEGGRITTVTDQLGNGGPGRTTTFEYRLAPNDPLDTRIRRIIDPAGKRYEFYYDGDHLTAVVFASHLEHPTYTFAYEQYGLMTKVQPPRGTVDGYGYAIHYDGYQRVDYVDDPPAQFLPEIIDDGVAPEEGMARFRVYYDDPADTMVSGKSHSRVENRRGKPTVYAFDRMKQYATIQVWDAAAIAAANDETPAILPVERTYDKDLNILTEKDRWGKTTEYTYVAQPPRIWMKNLVETVKKPNPGVGDAELVDSFTYWDDDYGNVKTHTTYAKPAGGADVEARTTKFFYNEFSQKTFVYYPGVTRPNVTDQGEDTVFTKYDYNDLHQLTQVTDEEGRWTEYSVFHPLHGLPMHVLRVGGSQPEETEYDVMGNVVATKRPKGGYDNEDPNWTIFGLDDLYRVHTVTDPLGQVTTNEYDLDSNLISVQPPLGLPTTTIFDKRGLVSGGTTPDGLWYQYADSNGNVRRKSTIRGAAYGYTTNTYFDSLDRAIETRVPGASLIAEGGGGPTMVTKWVHDGFDGTDHFSTATSVGGPQDRVTKTIFDNRGRAKQVLAGDNKTRTENFYDEQDQLVATQVFYDNVFQTCTVTLRDERDRVYCTRVQNAPYLGTPTQHSDTYTLYNKAGFVWRTVDPLGSLDQGDAHTTTFVPDIRGRVWKVIDGYGVTVKENLYGDDDLLIEVRVPDPETKSATLVTAETRTYTARKELKTVKNRDGVGITNTYTAIQGQIDTMTDAFGIVTKSTYYANTLRVDEVIEAQGTPNERRTKSVWQNGMLSETRVWNPAALSYSSSYFRYYDKADRLERYEAPLVAAERYYYNAFGEQSQTVIGSKTVDHTFNVLGQRTDSQWSGAYSDHEVRTYNGIGLPETVTAAGREKTMLYDTWLGTPNVEGFKVGGNPWKSQIHSYDVARNYKQFIDAEGGVHEWKYDADNRVYETWYANHKLSNVTFTPGGLTDKTTLRDAAGNAIAETTLTYDHLGRKARQQTVQLSTNKVVADLEWGYNELDLVVSIKFHHLGAEVTLGYNERRELTSEILTGNGSGETPPPYTNQIGGLATGNESLASNEAPATPQGVTAVTSRSANYVFDPAGNRTSQTIDGVTTTFTHNGASQLTEESVSGQTVYHHYDEWGNETGRGPVEGVPTESYGYNYLNLMSTYTNSTTGANWQYDFWPTGERYAKTNLTTNLMEIYVPRAGDVATEYDKPDGGPIAFKNRYVQGIGIDQKQTRISSTGDRRHYIGDQVGTVDVTLTDTGAVAESGLKDAWGVQLAGGTPSERYGFAHREHDAESGLVHMRARMYDPKLGRFTQTDPIAANRATEHYSYGTNNPISKNDPQGTQSVLIPTDEKTLRAQSEAIGEHVLPRVVPALQMGFGLAESVAGMSIAIASPEPLSKTGGVLMVGHGYDMLQTGWNGFVAGETRPTYTATESYSMAKSLGASDDVAAAVAFTADIAPSMGTGIIRNAPALVRQAANELANARGLLSPKLMSPQVASEAPPFVYRAGGKSPSNLTPRVSDEGMLSARDSLSNPWPLPKGQQPPLPVGKQIQVVDTSKLPPGSVVVDNVSPGHVSIGPNVPAQVVKDAIVETLPAVK